MKFIIGLGNPTAQYVGTRHNIGFDVITRLADDHRISVTEKKHKALCGKGIIGGEKVILIKPQTYMNLSGESVRDVLDFYKAGPEDIIVCYDDVSLAPGQLRVREKGSAGGHNGIKNIIAHLGTEEFARVRVVWEKSRRAGIWQITCWADFRRKRSLLYGKRWQMRPGHVRCLYWMNYLQP